MPDLSSLAQSLDPVLNENRGDVLLTGLNAITDEPEEIFSFQYFPETLQSSKQVNFQTKEIPGGSLPLYQWVNSGEHIITFTAFFTSDVDLYAQGQTRAPELIQRIKSSGVQRRNIDIRTVLPFLRQFQLPRYSASSDTGGPLTFAPRKLVLSVPRSGIGLIGGSVEGTAVLPDSIICLMMSCEIVYEAFFPSGLPRVVSIQLSFAQTAQYAGQVSFPQNPINGSVIGGPGTISFGDSGRSTFFPYPIQPRRGR